jgi:glyoxylase-like metal-dependent hydrolase (beta-lactamase superfamily II)
MDARINQVAGRGSSAGNTWLIGDDDEVIVVDPGDDAETVLAAVGDREILAVICTHGHAKHVRAAFDVAAPDEAPVALHRRDLLPWREVHGSREPDIEMEAGGIFEVADVALEVLHTPGHTPGSVSLYCADLAVVFSGDALLADGPAPHRREFPDFAAQMSAIGEELLTLPGETRVLPGHGEETTVAAAEKNFDSWLSEAARLHDPPE